ncbi:TWS1-like protein precursor [Senna tora]|uniref:TWS1-like protein n=1 Tax=Senna tora TaxID=362788 RepID=A0A834T828_9FABA|nr:TWS1-like protein precursor [Senna tora]
MSSDLPLFLNAILDFVPTNCADSTTMIAVSRKLKENGNGISSRKKDDTGHATLDDYQPVDPVPSSKTSLKPGPIEHGSPLNPFIPKPSPPPRPPAGGF